MGHQYLEEQGGHQTWEARGSFATGSHEQTPMADGRKGRGRLRVKALW